MHSQKLMLHVKCIGKNECYKKFSRGYKITNEPLFLIFSNGK